MNVDDNLVELIFPEFFGNLFGFFLSLFLLRHIVSVCLCCETVTIFL